mmetsp:Transcript_19168/g.23641  ORF Transcript_19168/g.23641 Transcript_19168/m.23641 type:complete len:127 (+) Transcript_19168:49-429(+)
MAKMKPEVKVAKKVTNGQLYPGTTKAPFALLLWSSLSSTSHQTSKQKMVQDTFLAKKVRFENIDGAQLDNKVHRNKFFNISKVRGKYPQIFLCDENKKWEYIGMDEEFQYLLDDETFDTKFKGAMQ